MSILFNKAERGNPANPQAPKLWYPVLKSTGLIHEKEVAKLLADETTLNSKEAEFAIAQLFKVVTQLLLDGKTVQLGDLGHLRVTAHSEGAATQAEVTARQIKRLTIRFSESDATKEELKKATFIAIDSL
ncbi:MAG: HU family DNA-binding protein [Prevotellaceae bacterium]|jgi:predicted histone-like DNA-binding protein|nr:HU family DNA-binding protein [Prevotellaceae bacterium]